MEETPAAGSNKLTPEQELSMQQQSLNLIIQGIHLAQQRGAYSLKEAATLHNAVASFKFEN